jgi:hypothetical protein
MYSGEDAGEVSCGEEVGARELLSHQKHREMEKERRLSRYRESRLNASILASDAFSIDLETATLPDTSKTELDVLKFYCKLVFHMDIWIN